MGWRLGYAANHWVYDKVCSSLFAREELLVGGIAAKPLAHDIGTSIVPVREALIRLSAQDVIEWIPSKGFFVSAIRGSLFAAIFRHAYDVAMAAIPGHANDESPAQAAIELADDLSDLHSGKFDARSLTSDGTVGQASEITAFDRNFLSYARLVLSAAQAEILNYIWVRTMQFRYYLYHNFDIYARSFCDLPAVEDKFSARTFISDVLLRYSEVAVHVADRAAVKQRPSPFM